MLEGIGSPKPKSAMMGDLETELRQAVAEIESGNYIELTESQLERCVDGEWPWPDESLD